MKVGRLSMVFLHTAVKNPGRMSNGSGYWTHKSGGLCLMDIRDPHVGAFGGLWLAFANSTGSILSGLYTYTKGTICPRD